MEPWTTYAWILLAVRPEATTRDDLLWRADAINKAPTTDREVDESVAWLLAAGLIESVADGVVQQTAAGRRLVEEEWTTPHIHDTWPRVAERLRTGRFQPPMDGEGSRRVAT
jgi:hypothetical protein